MTLIDWAKSAKGMLVVLLLASLVACGGGGGTPQDESSVDKGSSSDTDSGSTDSGNTSSSQENSDELLAAEGLERLDIDTPDAFTDVLLTSESPELSDPRTALSAWLSNEDSADQADTLKALIEPKGGIEPIDPRSAAALLSVVESIPSEDDIDRDIFGAKLLLQDVLPTIVFKDDAKKHYSLALVKARGVEINVLDVAGVSIVADTLSIEPSQLNAGQDGMVPLAFELTQGDRTQTVNASIALLDRDSLFEDVQTTQLDLSKFADVFAEYDIQVVASQSGATRVSEASLEITDAPFQILTGFDSEGQLALTGYVNTSADGSSVEFSPKSTAQLLLVTQPMFALYGSELSLIAKLDDDLTARIIDEIESNPDWASSQTLFDAVAQAAVTFSSRLAEAEANTKSARRAVVSSDDADYTFLLDSTDDTTLKVGSNMYVHNALSITDAWTGEPLYNVPFPVEGYQSIFQQGFSITGTVSDPEITEVPKVWQRKMQEIAAADNQYPRSFILQLGTGCTTSWDSDYRTVNFAGLSYNAINIGIQSAMFGVQVATLASGGVAIGMIEKLVLDIVISQLDEILYARASLLDPADSMEQRLQNFVALYGPIVTDAVDDAITQIFGETTASMAQGFADTKASIKADIQAVDTALDQGNFLKAGFLSLKSIGENVGKAVLKVSTTTVKVVVNAAGGLVLDGVTIGMIAVDCARRPAHAAYPVWVRSADGDFLAFDGLGQSEVDQSLNIITALAPIEVGEFTVKTESGKTLVLGLADGTYQLTYNDDTTMASSSNGVIIIDAIVDGQLSVQSINDHWVTSKPKVIDVSTTEVVQERFFVHHERKTWAEASDVCKANGQTLASINSQSENDLLLSLLTDAVDPYYSIGGQLSSSGTWLWSDGSGLNYQNWLPSEPSGDEDKLLFSTPISNSPGKWADALADNYSTGFVCEYRANDINLAPYATVTSSSQHPEHQNSTVLATDLDEQTQWVADGADGNWLQLNWTKPIDIERIVVKLRADAYYDPIYESRIDLNDDFSLGYTNTIEAQGTYTFSFTGASANAAIGVTKVRFNIIRGLKNSGLRELEVFGRWSDGTSGTGTISFEPSKLNDTGITWGGNYSSGNNTDCSSNIDAPQDCHQGRDAMSAAQLDKIGGGDAGFDFSKVAADGTLLPDSATTWACVQDNHTGLIWEVKTDDGGLHDKDNTYRWGGKTAIGREADSQVGTYYDDWNTLIDGSNNDSLCGFNDWRLPTREELRSIVHYGKTNPSIDSRPCPTLNCNSSGVLLNTSGASDKNLSCV